MVLLTTTSIALFSTAFYLLACAIADVPSAKTSKMMLQTRKQIGSKSDSLMQVYITRIAEMLAVYYRMDQLRHTKIQAALDIVGEQITPEAYAIRAVVTALLISLCAVPALFIQPLLAMVAVGAAVTMFFSSYQKVFEEVKKRRKLIDSEIPRFATSIAQSLAHSRDVLSILISYRRIAGKELGSQLDRTIADMRTGNYEQALLRLEARVGSTLLGDVTRGLIGTLRGDDQHMYFQMLVFDMRQIEQAALRKEVARRPKKIQKYSMLMLVCIIILYVVVLSVEASSSLGVIFF